MKDVLEDVQAWVDRGDRVAIATVVGVKRSAPRAPGAKMAVNEHGEVSGAVSGGCVEGAVVEAAAEVLSGAGAQAAPLRHRRQRGLGCWTSLRRGNRCIRGGVLPVSLQSEFAEIAAMDGRAALVTVIAGPELGAKLLVRADGSTDGGARRPGARRRGGRGGRGAALGRALGDARGGRLDAVRRRRGPGAAPDRVRRGGLRGGALQRSRGRRAGGRSSATRARSSRPAERFPDAEEVDRRLAGRGVRAPRRDRPRHLHRGPHPRPEARRRGAHDRAALRCALRGRDGQPPRAGAAARAPARGRA